MKHKELRFLALLLAMIMLLSLLCTTAMAAYRTIPFGEESDDVRKLQDALRKKGMYKGAIDGKFGAATKKAVINFQKSIGIHPDGRPGNQTLTALYEGKSAILSKSKKSELLVQTTTNSSHSLSYGNTGKRVVALQKALKSAGCYRGSIDGIYGDLTYLAVKKYQSKKGLHVDGIAGKNTIASLNKNTNVKITASFLLDIGSAGTEVKKVTNFLVEKGYLTSGGRDYTTAVKDAVKAWQKKNGKSATGTITESEYNRIVLGYEKYSNCKND